MSARRNFSMDEETESLLQEHSEDNHSELVRELLKEYYTAGVYDTEQAAIRVRKRELEKKRNELEREREAVDEELERLEGVEDDVDAVHTVEDIAETIELPDPSKATTNNPAIQRKAKENGIDAAVLLEAVKEKMKEREKRQIKKL